MKNERSESELPNGELSPEIIQILEDEAKEAEIQAAIDAAAEEGIIVSREEAARILLERQQAENQPEQTPSQ